LRVARGITRVSPSGFLLPTTTVVRLAGSTGQSGPDFGVEEREDLVLVPRDTFALTFTCGTTPHNGQIKLSHCQKAEPESLVLVPRLASRGRKSEMGEQDQIHRDLSGSAGCALSPGPGYVAPFDRRHPSRPTAREPQLAAKVSPSAAFSRRSRNGNGRPAAIHRRLYQFRLRSAGRGAA
jgi:hypothetical protein